MRTRMTQTLLQHLGGLPGSARGLSRAGVGVPMRGLFSQICALFMSMHAWSEEGR